MTHIRTQDDIESSVEMTGRVKLDKSEIQPVTLSLVDDIGIVFGWNGRLFRAIRADAVDVVRDAFDCGLIPQLVRDGLFPDSWITDYDLDGYEMVVEHTRISVVSYPYEWSFSMLKDAALTVLKVNLAARKFGFQTKDSHPFNVVFDGMKPQFVDLGSFTRLPAGCEGWRGYEEFLKSFYYPLRMWSSGQFFLARSMIANESELISHSEYLSYKHFLVRALPCSFVKRIIDLHFQYRKIALLTPSAVRRRLPGPFGSLLSSLKKSKLLPFQTVDFTSLAAKMNRIKKRRSASPWGSYHDEYRAGGGGTYSTPRFDRIVEIIGRYDIASAIELGGNQGILSRLLLERGSVQYVICTDCDEEAIDSLYRSVKGETRGLTPVLLNCMIPVRGSLGPPPHKRFRADVVIALALTHHLLLRDNFSIDFMLRTISQYATTFTLIEFMPLGLWDGKDAPPVPGWYTVEWFRDSLQQFGRILLEEQLEENRILFFAELDKHKPILTDASD